MDMVITGDVYSVTFNRVAFEIITLGVLTDRFVYTPLASFEQGSYVIQSMDFETWAKIKHEFVRNIELQKGQRIYHEIH